MSNQGDMSICNQAADCLSVDCRCMAAHIPEPTCEPFLCISPTRSPISVWCVAVDSDEGKRVLAAIEEGRRDG